MFVYSVFAGNNLQKACAAVGSYLLLRPEDETMLTNKNFYLQQAGISEEDFQPRKVIILYCVVSDPDNLDLTCLPFITARHPKDGGR